MYPKADPNVRPESRPVSYDLSFVLGTGKHNQEAQMMKKDEKKTILIIGDWFIDENWLVAKHKSYSSSHTGDIHYLSKHTQIDKRMISLCGAPEVLEVLRSYFANFKPHYLFKGFGVWNKEDDDILKCILCPDHTKNQYLSPYTIKSLLSIKKTICPYSKKECKYRPCLINIAQRNQASTNRIIRVYEGYKGGQPHLLYRFDWELPILEDNLDDTVFEKSIEPETVKAVVIVDHGKGVINDSTMENLISLLKKSKQNVKWYIRTKINNPTWMDKLAEAGIEASLKVIDEKLAAYSQGQRRWTFGRNLGRGSLEILGILTGDTIWKHTEPIDSWGDRKPLKSDRCAVIFDDNTAIAKHKQECYNLCDATGPKQLINIGHTTMFFNALIAQDLSDEFKGLDFGTQCWNAMECAFDWSKRASSAWNKEELYFYGDYQKALACLAKKKKSVKQWPASDYQKLWAKWDDSSREYGIVKSDDGDDRVDVWRGEGAIEGFICVGGPKRNAINDLLSKISDFHDQKHPKQPFNCLFVSSPGWGKSYLARCMAKHFEMNFMEFSLSQMATTRDLIDCFDTICSFQNRTQEKVVIFMDEINCNIEGHPATGLFLSPIWDGSFIRDGKMYKLSPAVWIFASTETTGRLIKQRKGSDFVSRLNGPIIELDKLCTKGGETITVSINELKNKLGANPNIDVRMEQNYKTIMGLHGEFKTEQVYLGISLLNNLWGPISRIQKGVLMLFHDILPINGFRSLEFFVSKFQNIQRGDVALSNVPIIDDFGELKRHVVLPDQWGKSGGKYDKQNFIEIVTLAQ